MTKRIEVEYRARFSKKEHDRLFNLLRKDGTDLGKDNKNVYFFTFPDKLLKISHNISTGTAKITGKLSKIGQGSDFEEIEFPISPSDIEKAVKLFKLFGFTEVHSSYQSRHNFSYKGVEIALKYSKMWGYHAEFEILIKGGKQKAAADQKIKTVARELKVNLMTEKELREFIQQKENILKSRESLS